MKHSSRWMRMMVALTCGAFIVLGAGLIRAFTPGGQPPKWVAPAAAAGKKNPVASNEASIETGRKIFGKECVSCHGKRGVGDGPKASDLSITPGNLSTKDFRVQSDGAIFYKITKGNKPMPMFGTAYSDQERWSLVNYIRTLGK